MHTEGDAIQHLREASTTLRDCQRRHKELRESHLESLAEAIVSEQAPALIFDFMAHIKEERAATQIQQLIKREKQRKSYRKIGNTLSPNKQLGLNKIDIPDRAAIGGDFGNPDDPKTWRRP